MNCPYCKVSLDYATVYAEWSNTDHLNIWDYLCPGCEATIEMEVQSVPEFIPSKKVCAKCQKNEPLPHEAYCDVCLTFIKAYYKHCAEKDAARGKGEA